MDIARHPERVQSLDAGLMMRIQSLVDKAELDLEAKLLEEDE